MGHDIRGGFSIFLYFLFGFVCVLFKGQAEQIKTEFLLLARKHHPDKQDRPGEAAATKRSETEAEETTQVNTDARVGSAKHAAPLSSQSSSAQGHIAFSRLSRAYRVLSDPSLRCAYSCAHQGSESACACACVCACLRSCACACVCVCVCMCA